MKCLAGVLLLLVLACGEDVPIAPASFPPSPPLPFLPVPLAAVAIVSGDGQTGTYGQFQAEPLKVRVTDGAGNGISGLTVRWSIPSGSGEFDTREWTTRTTAEGFSSITFRPMWPSPATVTASVAGFLPATFIESAGGPVVALMHVWPLFDCGDASLFLGPTRGLPVGALVEWDVWCGGGVRSVSVPDGGTPFDSGLLTGQRFTSRLDVAGNWIIEESTLRGTVLLTVR